MLNLAICITVKNRSRATVSRRPLTLLPNCLRSLAKACLLAGVPRATISITDWCSTDWPLEEWIDGAIGSLGCVLTPIEIKHFSRGVGLNWAARMAASTSFYPDVLFFCDADMLVDEQTIRQGVANAEHGIATFPIAQGYTDQNHTITSWMFGGCGNCFTTLEVWQRAGGWPEWTSWGGEDRVFMQKVAKLVPVDSPKMEGLRHQWHPNAWRYEHMEHPPLFDFRRAGHEDPCRIP